VFDGATKPNPEVSLHYCLLLGVREDNDRGEDGEGFNTPVCRLVLQPKAKIIVISSKNLR